MKIKFGSLSKHVYSPFLTLVRMNLPAVTSNGNRILIPNYATTLCIFNSTHSTQQLLVRCAIYLSETFNCKPGFSLLMLKNNIHPHAVDYSEHFHSTKIFTRSIAQRIRIVTSINALYCTLFIQLNMKNMPMSLQNCALLKVRTLYSLYSNKEMMAHVPLHFYDQLLPSFIHISKNWHFIGLYPACQCANMPIHDCSKYLESMKHCCPEHNRCNNVNFRRSQRNNTKRFSYLFGQEHNM